MLLIEHFAYRKQNSCDDLKYVFETSENKRNRLATKRKASILRNIFFGKQSDTFSLNREGVRKAIITIHSYGRNVVFPRHPRTD